MVELIVKVFISYLIGSCMGAMIIGRLKGGVDIRNMGSGNAGGTNALRTQGLSFAIGVIFIDIGKGVVGASFIPELNIFFINEVSVISREALGIYCSIAVVFGHIWPIYHRFRGGKGAGTFIGTLLVLSPSLLIGFILLWLIVLVLSGFVGLATMTAAATIPIYLGIFILPDNQLLFIYTFIMAVCIIFWHRSNIKRMYEGSEHQNRSMMIFSKRSISDNE
ncbi:MAG: acyl-phosphate glycerol 3-phosphate acyltransferase [Gammaproteobacteria bacterium]|nr:acyl-phosphate glycerol 3-phosphate acyltransferase [Gammaproteobacteria bacterium]